MNEMNEMNEKAELQQVELEQDEVALSLIEIQEGSSNRLGFTVAPLLLAALSWVTRTVQTEDYSGLPSKAHKSLYGIYQQAQKKGWEIQFVADPSQNIEPATISAESPVPKPAPALVRGTSTIFGRCIRVGGAEPKIDIRLSNRRRLLHVEATEEMAKRLARNLYESVAITGEATWEPETWEIVDFKATSVVNIQSTSPLQAFKELAEVVGDRWREVDVESFVRDVRSGEDGV